MFGRWQELRILERLNKLEKQMGSIADKLNTVSAALTKTQGDVATLATGVTGLNTTVAQLQAEIANQGDVLSPSTQAILDSLVAQGGTLQTAADAAAAELPAAPAA